jgi:hypothetical protein
MGRLQGTRQRAGVEAFHRQGLDLFPERIGFLTSFFKERDVSDALDPMFQVPLGDAVAQYVDVHGDLLGKK